MSNQPYRIDRNSWAGVVARTVLVLCLCTMGILLAPAYVAKWVLWKRLLLSGALTTGATMLVHQIYGPDKRKP